MAVADARESRPGGRSQAASEISTATKIGSRVAVCAVHGHDSPWPCALHGCPDCALEAHAYVDPEAYEPTVERLNPLWEYLAVDLAESYVDGDGCQLCAEILVRAAWARYPGWECESTCFVQHCTACGRCGQSGRVCRVCGLCVDHEEEIGSPCQSRTRWDRVRQAEVVYYRHELWNPGTGRWGR